MTEVEAVQIIEKTREQSVIQIACGGASGAAVTETGDLYCWGSNADGSNVPVKVLEKVKQVALGSEHTAAITQNGDLYCWGSNIYGQIGDGTTTEQKKVIKPF